MKSSVEQYIGSKKKNSIKDAIKSKLTEQHWNTWKGEGVPFILVHKDITPGEQSG